MRRMRAGVELPLAVLLLVFTLPIVWMVVLAFQPDRIIVTPAWNFTFTLDNLAALVAPDQPFTTQILNSVVIVLGTVALCVVIATLAGYGMAKLRISRWLTVPLLAACAVLPLTPPMALVPGFYVTLAQLGLLGTLPGLILLNTVLNVPFATLLMKLAIDENSDVIARGGDHRRGGRGPGAAADRAAAGGAGTGDDVPVHGDHDMERVPDGADHDGRRHDGAAFGRDRLHGAAL